MKCSSLICLFAIVLACALYSVEAQSKTCNLKEFDMCLTNFYYDQKGIPANEKQLRKTCTSTRTLSKCMLTYFTRCMGVPLKETFMIIMNSIMNPFLDTCNKAPGDEARQEIFKYAKCLNSNSKKISSCAEANRETVFYMLESTYDRRVPILCCNAQKVADCTYNKTAEVCDKSHADFQKNYYQASEVLREICGHYDPYGESCKDFMVPQGWKSSEDPKAPLARMINAFF